MVEAWLLPTRGMVGEGVFGTGSLRGGLRGLWGLGEWSLLHGMKMRCQGCVGGRSGRVVG